MVSDYTLYEYRHTILADMRSNADAALTLANEFNLSVDSVRGRLSRADTPENFKTLMQTLANEVPDIAPSVQKQLDILQDAQEAWDSYSRISGERTALFLSDVHLGIPRWDAYELAMLLVDNLKPHVVSGANDLRDNQGFSRWDERRSVRGQQWTSDDENLRKLERLHYKRLGKGSFIIQIQGNHDNWYYTNLRINSPQTAERDIAEYMGELRSLGVWQFSRGYSENYIQLGRGLVWWHGQFTNKNPMTLAKSNLEHFMHVFNDGVARSVVAGHTHRPMVVDGGAVGYPSVRYVNSGALTDYTPYMKRHPHNHGLGVVVCHYDANLWQHEVDLIQFQAKGTKLVARYSGVEYEVPLDLTHPNEYL